MCIKMLKYCVIKKSKFYNDKQFDFSVTTADVILLQKKHYSLLYITIVKNRLRLHEISWWHNIFSKEEILL